MDIELSADGVTESKSGLHKFYIFSLSFGMCKAPLPFRVWEFRTKTGPTLVELLQDIVQEFNMLGLRSPPRFVMDGKEQNYLRGMVTTNAYYGCARCLSEGTTQRYGKVHYPFHLINRSPRNHQLFVRLSENRPDLFRPPQERTKEFLKETKHERVGLLECSPLLDLHGFDIVEDIPLDAMHLIHHGITKKTWERMFETNVIWQNKEKAKVRQSINNLLKATKVPTEVSRKLYGVKPADMKASQWQVIDTFCLVSMALQLCGQKRLQTVLLHYAFLIRLCYSCEEVFDSVSQMLDCQKTVECFYKLYAKVFGAGCFTFNLHSFYHLIDCRRKHGPLWTYSTAKYEAMYAKTRNCYKGNTFNTPMQLLETYMAGQLQGHKCHLKSSMTLSDKETLKTNDRLIYVEGGFCRIYNVSDTCLTVTRLITRELNTAEFVAFPWAKVGVEVYLTEEDQPVIINKADVKAKAILCDNIVSICHMEWLIK